MHGKLAAKHLQFPAHRFLHMHLISSRHSFDASGITVQNGHQPLSSLFTHPQSAGEGISGLAIWDCPQMSLQGLLTGECNDLYHRDANGKKNERRWRCRIRRDVLTSRAPTRALKCVCPRHFLVTQFGQEFPLAST